jgi:hypothetical protein
MYGFYVRYAAFSLFTIHCIHHHSALSFHRRYSVTPTRRSASSLFPAFIKGVFKGLFGNALRLLFIHFIF